MFLFNVDMGHYDWQSTESFLYVVGKSNITLKWTYVIVLDF